MTMRGRAEPQNPYYYWVISS